MQEHILKHFSGPEQNRFLKDATFIDKTDPSNPLERENYWMEILQTMAPNGLNIEINV